MTSTESRIQSQRDLLLNLGFAQPAGFQYVLTSAADRYIVVTLVGREDELGPAQWEIETTAGPLTDLVLLSPGVSFWTFRAVVQSLL